METTIKSAVGTEKIVTLHIKISRLLEFETTKEFIMAVIESVERTEEKV